MLACGIIGELGNWIAGPNQGMYEAAKEGYMPKFFAKTTKSLARSRSPINK